MLLVREVGVKRNLAHILDRRRNSLTNPAKLLVHEETNNC